MRDTSDPLHLQVHLFIQQVWENGVKCKSSSHGPSRIGGRNRAAVVCCYLVQTILTGSAGPLFLAKQPWCTLLPLGWVHAYQPRGPLTGHGHVKAYFHCLSLPSSKIALLNLASPTPCWVLAFSAQRTLTWPCSCQDFFSIYLVTGLPHNSIILSVLTHAIIDKN
jgi:hypothetical protein